MLNVDILTYQDWPLGAVRLILKRKFFGGGTFFLWLITLGIMEIPSPKLVKNLPWTYNNLQHKGEPYRLDSDILRYTQKAYYFK